LLSAVWLHDMGKVLDKETKRFKKAKKDEKEIIKKEIRDLHHIRSYNFIKRNSNLLKLNDQEADAIGNICRAHRKNFITTSLDERYKINKKKVRLQFLGASLRLADKCDINSDRIVSKHFKKTRFTWQFPSTKKHKNFVNFGYSNKKIKLEAKVTSLKDLKILIDTKDKIQKELDETKSILSQNKLPLNTVELKLL